MNEDGDLCMTRRPTPQQPRHDKDDDDKQQERIIVLHYC